MSAIQYWKERLAARNPLHAGVWVEGRDYKTRKDRPPISTWPHSVCRAVIYEDYLIWHSEVMLAPYRGVAYYDENPDARPAPLNLIPFFTEISPFIYLVGKDSQVRSYPSIVVHQDDEGNPVRSRKFKYFVRLCEWEAHSLAFEKKTGIVLSKNLAFFDPTRSVIDLEEHRASTGT